MKKLVGSLLALTLMVGAAQAQDGKSQKAHGKHRGTLAQQLNLSEDQKKQLKEINADFRKQLQDLKKNENITVKELNSKKEEIRKDHIAKMQSILTPEQKAQMNKLRQDGKTRGLQKGNRGVENMRSQLNLSDDQLTKLKEARESFTAKAKEIRNNSSLTEEQKKSAFQSLAREQKEKTNSILTKEQVQKLEELRKERKERSIR